MAWFVDGQSSVWASADLAPAVYLQLPAQDRHGNVWVGSRGGLVKTRNGQLVKVYTKRDGLPGDDTKLVSEGNHNKLPLAERTVVFGSPTWIPCKAK